MWTFENPPYEYWRRTYGFEPTQEWLDHVRLSSVRYGQVCSASFVSPNGLVMTNHHCARGCIEAVSSAEQDYLLEGFHAKTEAEERVCPELYLDQLVATENVTQRIRGAAPAGASDEEIVAAQEAESERIVDACEASGDVRCQVVSLYHGGQYHLYQYKRYEPVKLVFAPELQAGYYGGDTDNFTYPRYALDVAFVRAYEADGGTPARTPHYFEWSQGGAADGELVFITGNPGSTSRQITVSELLYEQQYRHPFLLQFLEGQRDFLQFIATLGPEAERSVRDDLFSVENTIKAMSGQLRGLRDTLLVGQKIAWERDFRSRIEADPALEREYGDVWDRMARVQREKLELSPRVNISNFEFIGEPHTAIAGYIVRYTEEMARPEAERDEAYRGEAAENIRGLIADPGPLNEQISVPLLALRLELARSWLPADDPIIRQAFQPGETPRQAAQRLVTQSRIDERAFRESLVQGGVEAVRNSDDPMIQLARVMESVYRRVFPRYQEVVATEEVLEERLALALFAAFGTDLPPDATFTLRISDGIVSGYPYNGTLAPPSTSIYGLYGRAADFDNRMPFTLPNSFAAARREINMATPLNFVSTNDITGGNSGSPMIDRHARIVGIAFDGNIEQLPNEFLFRPESGARTVSVHSAGIIEALRNVYNTDRLLRELLGQRE